MAGLVTVRAVAISAAGGPEVLGVLDRDVREPGIGEVRITVRAAAVNPTDVGLHSAGSGALPPPWTPGMDAAGTIESVGPLERTDWLEQLRELAGRGSLQLRVAGEYPPERAAEAQERMAAGGLRGRVLIIF